MKTILASLMGFIIPLSASAHVGYVVSEADMATHGGPDVLFLLSVFNNTNYILLMLGTALILVLAVIYIPKIPVVKKWFAQINERLTTYGDFLPWMARLSLGIALIGAGSAHVFISPLAHATDTLAIIELVLGFMFLAGFLLVPATIATIVLYLGALSSETYIFGNLDFFALALAFLALHNERPGVDDIFGIKALYGFRLPRKIAPLLLRIGIGFGMAFLALYEKLLNPHLSELVVNQFNLTAAVNVTPAMWVFGAGVIELAVALCLLFGFYTRLTTIIACLVLTTTFFFFQEAVYSHVTLFGLLSILFVTGGGMWSIDEFIARRKMSATEKMKIG